MLGLGPGDAHIIRNAGGRAADALRSLMISQAYLNTTEIAIIHHTDCGMLTINDTSARNTLIEQVGEENRAAVEAISFQPITAGLEESVRADMNWVKLNPLLSSNTVTGFVYNVSDGSLAQVFSR